MAKARGGAGGGAGGGGVTSGLVMTTGMVDASIRDVNDRFGFAQPAGALQSDEGVQSHVRATQGASDRFLGAGQPDAQVRTTSERLTAAQSPINRSSTAVTTRITGTQGDSNVTIRSVGLNRGQGGPRVEQTSVTARARGQNMARITQRQGESASVFGRRVRQDVGRFFDRVALKTVEKV